jgi:hypothetical protein
MQLPSVMLSFLVVASQGVQTPTAETEGLSIEAPASFVVGHRDNDDTINVVELVKPPETVDSWSQLISVATIMHASETSTLARFYAMWRDQYRETCPGPNETVVRGTVDGRLALKATFQCPLDHKTGKPESLTVVFVQGQVNLLTAQMAFRRSMTASDKAMVNQMLKSMKLCDARDKPCFARPARGFLPDG